MGWVSRADEMGHVYIGQLPAYGTADSRSSARLSVRRAINLCRPSLLYLSPFSSFPSRHPRHPSPSPSAPPLPRCHCRAGNRPSDSPEQPNHTPSRHAGPMIAWRCLHILSPFLPHSAGISRHVFSHIVTRE